MNRRKSAKVVIVKNSQMDLTSTKFRNFFYLEKFLVWKLENFEKQLLLFKRSFTYISIAGEISDEK